MSDDRAAYCTRFKSLILASHLLKVPVLRFEVVQRTVESVARSAGSIIMAWLDPQTAHARSTARKRHWPSSARHHTFIADGTE